ncbi:MAG TPA: universal stress protein [Steroidobacteraceae bacterium]|nr:universal stress protein [Steroidobacteraceae bacterium]
MFKRVLLCYDGSAVGRRALRRGAELAILVGAKVHVLSIVPTSVVDPVIVAGAIGQSCLAGDKRENRKLLDESIEWLRQRGVAAEGYLANGNTIDVILAYAKKLDIDLIVLGHYPQPAGGFWWSGPQRTSLAERANCCVFVAVDATNDLPAATPANA